MTSTYIKFTAPGLKAKGKEPSLFKRIFKTLLISFIPSGNPNFENEIQNVQKWLIEFKDGNPYPNREIGLTHLEQPIMIMPWRRNYGYWIDTNLLLQDSVSTFNTSEITKEEFEKYWTHFEEKNENT